MQGNLYLHLLDTQIFGIAAKQKSAMSKILFKSFPKADLKVKQSHHLCSAMEYNIIPSFTEDGYNSNIIKNS